VQSVLERKGALVRAVVDGTALAPDLSGNVLDELQRAVRAIATEVTAGMSDSDLVQQILRQARAEIDATATAPPGARVRSPEETEALRRALEILANALSSPPAERYRFASASHPGVEYEITVDGADVFCTCPGFEYRGQCRHARDIKAAMANGRGIPAGYSRST
jgi:hypothetical protein